VSSKDKAGSHNGKHPFRPVYSVEGKIFSEREQLDESDSRSARNAVILGEQAIEDVTQCSAFESREHLATFWIPASRG